MRIRTKKGLVIPISGRPEQVVGAKQRVRHVALLGPDYAGLKPKVLVDVEQTVSLGEPLIVDKRDPDAPFASPGTGRVVAINRGRRRVLQSVVVALDETAAPETVFDIDRPKNPAAIRNVLLRSGTWSGFRTRPYNRVPHSQSSPRSLFVTATDTRPLAADPNVVVKYKESEFQRGMEILTRLGDWPVYLCTGPDWSGAEFEDGRIRRVEFNGPHPAGLVGTHIHHLDPVAADRTVWHIGYQDVIAIGHLFATGRLLAERIVSVAGPGAVNPRLLRTRMGADVTELMAAEVNPDQACRLVSGSVLDGASAVAPMAYLGRYHNQITVLPEKAERRLFGWMTRGGGAAARSGRFARPDEKRAVASSAPHGTAATAAMMPVGAFERVIPFDILPVPLLRALLVKDTDAAQALGCLELAEEDLALTSFVCPAKQNYGAALRINLDRIEEDG